MKERNKQIDQIIQSRLNDYSSPSSEDLWDRIDAKRSKKEDDTGTIWWRWSLVGIAVLFVAVGLTLWSNTSDRNSIMVSDDTTTILENASNDLEKESIEASSNAANLADQQSKAADDLLLSIDDVHLNENSKNKKQNQASTATKKTIPSSTIFSSQDDSKNIQSNSVTTKSIVTESTEIVTSEHVNTKTSHPNTLTPEHDNTLTRQYPNTKTPQHHNTNKTEATPQNYLKAIYLPTSQRSLLELERTIDEDLLKVAEVETLPRGCYSFPVGPFKYDFYVDAIVSAEHTTRTLKAKDTTESSDYVKNREASESEMYSFSSGVRLSFVTEGGVALRTGLIYNQILERFKYENGSATRTVIDVINVNGTMDTTIRVETGTQVKTIYNRYRSFDIPLILGYELHKPKMVFNINGGVYFNIWSKQKGEFSAPNANDLPIKFNSGNPTAQKVFHDRLGLSFYGSLGFNYKINDALQLIIEPNVRYQLHSITIEDYPLEQKFINVGLMTGLRLQF